MIYPKGICPHIQLEFVGGPHAKVAKWLSHLHSESILLFLIGQIAQMGITMIVLLKNVRCALKHAQVV
jgi:hypothetical protein